MSTTDFVRDPLGFAATYPLLIDETSIADISPRTGKGNHEMLDTDTFRLYLTVEPTHGNNKAIKIHKRAPPGIESVYFLPYVPDAATSMRLGADCDYFFTSSLSGCAVQVFGSPASPTVTHANCRETYGDIYGPEHGRLTGAGLDEVTAARRADRRANAVVDTHIDRMLPDPGRRRPRILRKTDYLGKLTQTNYDRAETEFLAEHKGVDQWNGFKLEKIGLDRSGGKPTIGATVFGIRDFRGVAGWTFFYQATAGISRTGKKKTGFLNLRTKRSAMSREEVVLGGVEQLFP